MYITHSQDKEWLVSWNNKNYNKQINIWLTGLILLIGLIIIVGGLTRLTNSGLSIIEWELFEGILPPLNNEQWVAYFKSYQTIPQYEILNKMNLYIFL